MWRSIQVSPGFPIIAVLPEIHAARGPTRLKLSHAESGQCPSQA